MATIALCGCDDVFGLTRHVDAGIDTPADAKLGRPDAPTDAPIDASIDAPIGAVCPSTYGPVMAQGSYRFIAVPTDWASAEAMCEADQIAGATRFTHLAVIEQDPERGRLNATQPKRSWIGLSDRVSESVYRWVTNAGAVIPASGSPWAAGEPDHARATDDCVEMGGTADYAESDCAAPLPVWCECDDRPPIAALF